jgi:hypothetical protein
MRPRSTSDQSRHAEAWNLGALAVFLAGLVATWMVLKWLLASGAPVWAHVASIIGLICVTLLSVVCCALMASGGTTRSRR